MRRYILCNCFKFCICFVDIHIRSLREEHLNLYTSSCFVRKQRKDWRNQKKSERERERKSDRSIETKEKKKTISFQRNKNNQTVLLNETVSIEAKRI